LHSVRQRYRGPRRPHDRGLTASSRRGSPTRPETGALSIRDAIDSAAVDVDMGDREEIAGSGESDSDVDATREVEATDPVFVDRSAVLQQLSARFYDDYTARSPPQTDEPAGTSVVPPPVETQDSEVHMPPADDHPPGPGGDDPPVHEAAPEAPPEAGPEAGQDAAEIPPGQEGNWWPGGPRSSILIPSIATHIAPLIWRASRVLAGVADEDVLPPRVELPRFEGDPVS